MTVTAHPTAAREPSCSCVFLRRSPDPAGLAEAGGVRAPVLSLSGLPPTPSLLRSSREPTVKPRDPFHWGGAVLAAAIQRAVRSKDNKIILAAEYSSFHS